MDRLTSLDAEFLHLEDGINHMHIAGACVFADPPPTMDELRALVASKLSEIPRYRQRVRTVPYELGRPVWVDDPHFDLDYHLRHVSLPGAGDADDLDRLVGQLMSQPLGRDRPLWETTLVEGLEGGRWALVFKVHHCMVDGIAGVGLLAALLDMTPDAELPEPEPWEPEPEPAGAAKVIDAWSGLAKDTFGIARSVPHALTHPMETARSAADLAQGFVRLGREMRYTPELSIEGPIGPNRSWSHSTAAFDDVRRIRAALGGTVNDVVLCAVAGGFRALLDHRGESPDDALIRTAVPVSTRRSDGDGVPDNRVTSLLYELPVGEADPVRRLSIICEEMAELKASHMAEFGDVVTHIGDLAPPMVIGPASRVVIRAMNRLPQRSLNTITTNVPGPQFPIYCLGREMLEYLPFVPIVGGVRVATAILSYNGQLHFGVTGDKDTTPDVGVMATAIADSIAELREAAGATQD